MSTKMKGLLMAALTGFSTIMAGSYAEASHKSQVVCKLEFVAEGYDIGISVLGPIELRKTDLSGVGRISCWSPITNKVTRMKVAIDISEPEFNLPGVAFVPYMKMYGLATGIGLNFGGPRALLGTYLVGSASAAVGVGASAQVALHGTNNALTINAAIAPTKGLGLAAGTSLLTIREIQ